MAWDAFYQRDLDVIWLEVDASVLNRWGVLYASSNVIRKNNPPAVTNNPTTALGGDDQAEILMPFPISPSDLRIEDH
jgi:hypothetical protein